MSEIITVTVNDIMHPVKRELAQVTAPLVLGPLAVVSKVEGIVDIALPPEDLDESGVREPRNPIIPQGTLSAEAKL